MPDEFVASDRARVFRPDEIRYWTEVKLEIVRDYAKAYATIMQKQKEKRVLRRFAYIDAFAGAGLHISRATGTYVLGSPLNALVVRPSFDDYYYIDLDSQKAGELRAACVEHGNVHVWEGDCNSVLLSDVFPQVRYEDYRRALCLLDPYGLHLQWDVMREAGAMRSVELFLNFPVMDMNMNVLWQDAASVDSQQAARLTRYWGDESWRDAAYRPSPDLFDEARVEKVPEANAAVAAAFRTRLRTAAGFAYVPAPLAMRNSRGAVVYYLFFAAQKPVASKIVNAIFRKYANVGLATRRD